MGATGGNWGQLGVFPLPLALLGAAARGCPGLCTSTTEVSSCGVAWMGRWVSGVPAKGCGCPGVGDGARGPDPL